MSDKKPSQRGAAQAEIARLRLALEEIHKLADLAPTPSPAAPWAALGGIKWTAATALQVQS